jgi:hypothetical protein
MGKDGHGLIKRRLAFPARNQKPEVSTQGGTHHGQVTSGTLLRLIEDHATNSMRIVGRRIIAKRRYHAHDKITVTVYHPLRESSMVSQPVLEIGQIRCNLWRRQQCIRTYQSARLCETNEATDSCQ